MPESSQNKEPHRPGVPVRILAVDPGPTTGLCIYDSEARQAKSKGIVDVWNEELGTLAPHNQLWNVLETTTFDMLIVERFEFRKDDAQRAKIDYRAAEYVGVCKLWAQQAFYGPNAFPLKMVSASTIGKTAFWSDDNRKVKEIGLYNAKAAPHGMDALRHILYYVTFTCSDNFYLRMLI
jgi:hypothetical protein